MGRDVFFGSISAKYRLPTGALLVCDPVDDCDTDSTTIAVSNMAPTINSVTVNGPVNPNQAVTITVDAIDPVDSLTYSFDCEGDGIYEIDSQTENTVTCTYAAGGTYNVQVSVDDGDGGSSNRASTVEIAGIPAVSNEVSVELHTIDPSRSVCPNNRPVCTDTLDGIMVRAFNRSHLDFIAQFGSGFPLPWHYDTIFEQSAGYHSECGQVIDGACPIYSDNTDDYDLVIAKFEDNTAELTQWPVQHSTGWPRPRVRPNGVRWFSTKRLPSR